MKLTLKRFQELYVGELHQQFAAVKQIAGPTHKVALLLNAPTGSGKTLMATTFIEELLLGSETTEPDRNYCFLWLTDQPELNKQTLGKMLSTSDLPSETLVVINGGFDLEFLEPSRVYFLNTQKLGTGTSFVKHSDERQYTLWETINRTVEASSKKFVLIIDEAHRGTQGREAAEAETIVQKFMKGSAGEVGAVPIVLGISATPSRFVQLCADTNRPLFQVDVDTDLVRESGLLKEIVDLYHPDEEAPSDITMLIQAATDWKQYRSEWATYGAAEGEATPTPVMVVQVEDARSGSSSRSKTDLGLVVRTIATELGDEATDGWLCHAFQDDTGFVVDGNTARYLAPSEIDGDPDVKVVLFKSSLNTGWDCPRAEVMVSLRTARDETAIAQLVGRMVRAPLGRRIDTNEHLNTVALYLPSYDRQTVERVVARLTGDPAIVPPTTVREGKRSVTLHASQSQQECFVALRRLPSYTVPPARPIRPVARLGRLATLLAVSGLDKDPVKTYRARLIGVLEEARARLEAEGSLKHLLDEGGMLEVRRRRMVWGLKPGEAVADGQLELSSFSVATKTIFADENVDDLFGEAGRRLGEGLHKEYLRKRMQEHVDARTAKLEIHALVSVTGVLETIDSTSDELRNRWVAEYKATFAGLDEKSRQAFREIQGAGSDSIVEHIDPPQSIEWTKADKNWPRHLYVDDAGEFPEDFAGSSWEKRAVEVELKDDLVVGWLRNPARKPWSLCITRLEGTRYVPFFPDLIIFRRTPGGLIADLIDPHLLAAEDMPARAVRLAQYAQAHSDQFGRIEMVIFDNVKDKSGRRLDLTNEILRNKVAGMTTTKQLRNLFEELKLV